MKDVRQERKEATEANEQDLRLALNQRYQQSCVLRTEQNQSQQLQVQQQPTLEQIARSSELRVLRYPAVSSSEASGGSSVAGNY